MDSESDALRRQLEKALGDAYTVERELGRGGMATVFLAHDAKHDRHVAVKVFAFASSAELGSERFTREIRFAARLQHPHLLPVLDSGVSGNLLWYSMPYVTGQTVRERLTRNRELPVHDAVRIVREAALGLQCVHEHGIVHRDVKPENLLQTADGLTVVADFGIARALEHPDDDGAGGRLTKTGSSIGTPTYMSPEQAAGDRNVDARTDIYALGTVLYELLAGEPPFTGPTPQAVLAKRLATAAPSIRVVRPGVSRAVDAVVTRALATSPADRFQTARDFATALEEAVDASEDSQKGLRSSAVAPTGRRAVLVAMGLVAVVAGTVVWRLPRHEPAAAGPPALAVIPFESIGDSTERYFADGITDEVRGKLAGVASLRVIAGASSREYRGTSKPLATIARELGVRYLLVGRIYWQKALDRPKRVRVAPELIDASSGRTPATKWQREFDAELSDVFRVQSEIAEQVIGELKVAVGALERRNIAEPPTANLDAYDAFVRGREVMMNGGQDPAALRRAIELYREAVRRDSTFALAWAALVSAHTLVRSGIGGRPDDNDSARVAMERARVLAPNRVFVRAVGALYEGSLGHFDRALADATSLLAEYPNDAGALNTAAGAEYVMGRFEESAAHLRQADSLDPRNVDRLRVLGDRELLLRRYDAARTTLDRALARQPDRADFRAQRAMVEVASGDSAAARRVIREAPPATDVRRLRVELELSNLAWLLGDTADPRALFRLEDFSGNRAMWAFSIASAFALRGDLASARTFADSSRLALGRPASDDPEGTAVLALLLAYSGRPREALAEADSAERQARAVNMASNTLTVLYFRARVFLAVGDRERAIEALEVAERTPGYWSPGWIRVDPYFSSLRGNPRFDQLVSRPN